MKQSGSNAGRHFLFLVAAVFLGCLSGCQPRKPGDEFTRLTNVGKNYYDQGEAAKAIAAFQQAVAANPAHPDAQSNLANALLLGNQSEAAIKHAQEALNLDRNAAAAYYVMGCAYLRLSNFEPAVQALQQAKQFDPTVAAVSFQLGVAQQGMNRFEDALNEFRETIALEAEHPAAHYRLSQLLVRVGQPEEASQALEKHRDIAAKKKGPPPEAATYERSKYTLIRLPFKLEQPATEGIKIAFTDVSKLAFGGATNFYGPVGVLDLRHDGRNSLFVREGDQGFRLLVNSNGTFQPQGAVLPGIPGGKYHRVLVGELHNDRFEDVIVLGEQGSHVYKFVTNAVITEVTRFAGLKDLAAIDGALVDLDFTGKLDLLTLHPDGKTARSFRNLGNFYFKENTATSGLPATLTSARQMILDDWNNDDLSDVFIARSGQPPLLLVKQRGGPLTATNAPPDWPAGNVVATGDLNNDWRTDLLVATGDRIECIYAGLNERTNIPLGTVKVTSLQLVDYDNDGWLDIVATGEGVRVWRNLGRAGFREMTQSLGFDKLGQAPVVSLTAADFDQDGDTDFLLSAEKGGLQLFRNDGGNANHQLKLRLLGHRSNPSGLGMRLEMTAGGLRTSRTVTQLPIEIGVGKNTNVDSLTVRWFDLAVNNSDIKVEPQLLALEELQLPTGSCPYLYAWDGKRFRFVTDLLGAAPIGLRISDTRFVEADPVEYAWIGNETNFQPRHGNYVLQITEELREVLYLDEAKLVVIDHPPGTEVHTTGKLRPGQPFPPSEIITLHQQQPLQKALNHEGAEVTALLQKTDGNHVSPTKLRVPQLRGLAEPHSITLDFGPLDATRPLVLALTGWLRFGGGMANVGASHHPDLPFPFPMLEVETAQGQWQPVEVVVGAPAGKTKNIVVDLAGKLPVGSRRLRLSTAFEIHWDRIALFEKRDNAETRISTQLAAGTDLHWRGYSEFEDLPWFMPLTPGYEQVNQSAKWRITPSGWCTRYGPVNDLIGQRDNALALINGGDELTLNFPADRLPPKPNGAVRNFFLYSVGWDKDADFHCELGWQVGPLPWHGMDDQLYGRELRPAFPSDGLMERYNTRWVGPYTLTRKK